MKHRLSLPLLLLAVIMLIGTAVYWQTGTADARGVLVQAYLDTDQTIAYVGNVDDTGSPLMAISYDTSSISSLRHYAVESQARGDALLKAGVSDFYVWVTFRRTLSADEFRALVKETGLSVQRYTMRAIGADGSRITIGGGPVDGEVLPTQELDEALTQVQAREGDQALTFSGIFEVLGTVNATGYKQLRSAPDVFMVDVTGTLVYRNANFQRSTRFSWKDFVAKFQISGNSPFWYMEDFGLDNFASDP